MPVNQIDLWDELDDALTNLDEIAAIFNKSQIEVCSFNFKYPLHKIDCVLVCTIDPKNEILRVAGMYMP